MTTKKFHVYIGDIRLNIHFSGVMSEKADACVVPHYENGISLTGVSAAFIHSMARNSILEYQNYVKDKKLEPGFAYIASCEGDKYRYLIHIPALKRSPATKKKTKEASFLGIYSALKGANDIKAKSIVIPSINTGSSGILSYEEIAHETFKAIKYFINETPNTSIKEITIALKSTHAMEDYLKKLQNFI